MIFFLFIMGTSSLESLQGPTTLYGRLAPVVVVELHVFQTFYIDC